MDGNLQLRLDLAAWPTRRLEKMGLCCRTGQSTRMVFLRLLSSPVGFGPDKLLVYVFLGAGSVEFLDEAVRPKTAMMTSFIKNGGVING